jgi:protein gp37
MGDETAISWADHTFNPWWGCDKISPGCKLCYAAAFDKRFGGDHWGDRAPRRFFGDKHWAEPLKWNRAAERAGVRRRVFCASMADVFEDRDDLAEPRRRLWGLIDECRALDWLLLTKRPENFGLFLPFPLWPANPWPHVWLGVTAENQEQASRRIGILARTPAALRFISAEPLLERVELGLLGTMPRDATGGRYVMTHERIHWVIAGAESGGGARAAAVDWFRALRDECRDAGVAFHLKQAMRPARRCECDQNAPAKDRCSKGWIRCNAGISTLEIRAGAGSKVTKGGLIHLPYLDGVQHAAFPEPR